MTLTNQTPLLFSAQIAFWILRILPESIKERQYQKAMSAYISEEG
jgi:hypothetical protein